MPAASAESLEARALLLKQWSKYKLEQRLADVRMLDRISFAQQKALDELRNESEELYQEAIQVYKNRNICIDHTESILNIKNYISSKCFNHIFYLIHSPLRFVG